MLKHTKLAFNDGVVCDGYSTAIYLHKATLVDQFTHSLQVWISGNKISSLKVYVVQIKFNIIKRNFLSFF